MALMERRDVIKKCIVGILEESMGDDYQVLLTKRCVLRKDDQLIKHIKRLEELLSIIILDTQCREGVETI